MFAAVRGSGNEHLENSVNTSGWIHLFCSLYIDSNFVIVHCLLIFFLFAYVKCLQSQCQVGLSPHHFLFPEPFCTSEAS